MHDDHVMLQISVGESAVVLGVRTPNDKQELFHLRACLHSKKQIAKKYENKNIHKSARRFYESLKSIRHRQT